MSRRPGIINRAVVTLAVAALAVVGGALAAGLSSASPRPAKSAAAKVQVNITATLIRRRPGSLKPGTRVRSARLGQRVFPNPRVGFALANVDGGQYPAGTVDTGKTWRTDGPVLHINAAQAPLSVVFVGAANARTFFAFGGGQVVDATGDRGKHWWQAFLGDGVLAVVPRLGGGLVAVSQDATRNGGAVNLVYVSTDGGHHWHLSKRFAP